MKPLDAHSRDFSLPEKTNYLARTLWFIFLTVLLFNAITVRADTQVSFEKLWPKLAQPWYFDDPKDIALDNVHDFVYITNAGNNSISKYTQSGEFIKQWILTFAGEPATPSAIAVDQDGFVYVVDAGHTRVQKFDSNGDYVADILLDLTDLGIELNSIAGLAFSSNGSLYLVSAGQENNGSDSRHAVWSFSQQGKFIQSWGEFGSAPGKLGHYESNDSLGPNDIAISNSGQVYIADTWNQRIQVFSLSGEYITGWGVEGSESGQFYMPISISIDSKNRIYVGDSDWRAENIQRFTEDGIFIDSFFSPVGNPQGLALNFNDSLFVADASVNRVFQLDTQGKLVSSWQSASDKEGYFNLPLGIDVDTEGNIYVVDNGNKRIQKFSSAGNFVDSWIGNSYAFDRGGFDDPGFIAVGTDAVYLTDRDKIIKFDHAGKHIATWTDNINTGVIFGITIDDNGIIYASMEVEQNGQFFQRIAVFNHTGQFLHSWQWQVDAWDGPRGLEVGDDGFLYVVSEDQIYKFDLDGGFIKKWPVHEEHDGSPRWSAPPDITIDSKGQIYTIDNGNVIRVFSSEGVLTKEISQHGSGPGSINGAAGLKIKNGKLYVSDTYNNRVETFDLGLEAVTTPTDTNKVDHKAIIVAGGGPYPGNFIWDDTQILANRAYSALRFQGFSKDQLKYLTGGNPLIDLDNNGNAENDAEAATKINLEQSIVEWAADAREVVIYMIDHGGPEKFQINEDEILVAEDLQNWLDKLSEKIPGKLTVIIEACKSGSFIPVISKSNRFVISSSSADQPAIISNKGLNAFSYFFWNEILNGATLQHAFKQGRQAMSSQLVRGNPQNAQLDSNGDVQFTSADLAELGDYCLGKCTTYAASSPTILSVNSSTVLQGETNLNLQMQVQSLDPILKAWATVVRPDYQHPDNDVPVSDLPQIKFSCDNNGVCTAKYEQFNVTGDYHISFYAQDGEYQLALPLTAVIQQTQSDTAVYDSVYNILTLNEVHAFGQSYRIELFDQGDFNFIVGTVLPLTESMTTFSADYNEQSRALSIPRVDASGQEYLVNMSHQGDYVFRVDSVSEFIP